MPTSMHSRAVVLSKQGRFEEIESILHRALTIQPKVTNSIWILLIA